MAKAIQEDRVQLLVVKIGRRVRTHIEEAERQLRRYESQQVPCLVILYENIVVNGFHPNLPEPFPTNPLNPSHIEVGMYGNHVAQVRIHPGGRTESLGDVRGGERTLGSGHQDNISAVATLHDYDSSNGLFLVVYHNFFAKNPLPKSVFTDSKDRQIEKPGHPDSCPGSWQPIQIE